MGGLEGAGQATPPGTSAWHAIPWPGSCPTSGLARSTLLETVMRAGLWGHAFGIGQAGKSRAPSSLLLMAPGTQGTEASAASRREGQWGDTTVDHFCPTVWHQATRQPDDQADKTHPHGAIQPERGRSPDPCSDVMTLEDAALREGQAQPGQAHVRWVSGQTHRDRKQKGGCQGWRRGLERVQSFQFAR